MRNVNLIYKKQDARYSLRLGIGLEKRAINVETLMLEDIKDQVKDIDAFLRKKALHLFIYGKGFDNKTKTVEELIKDFSEVIKQLSMISDGTDAKIHILLSRHLSTATIVKITEKISGLNNIGSLIAIEMMSPDEMKGQELIGKRKWDIKKKVYNVKVDEKHLILPIGRPMVNLSRFDVDELDVKAWFKIIEGKFDVREDEPPKTKLLDTSYGIDMLKHFPLSTEAEYIVSSIPYVAGLIEALANKEKVPDYVDVFV